MFGFLWGTITVIHAAIFGVKQTKENTENLQDAIRRDKNEIENNHVPHKTYYKYGFDGTRREVRYDNGHPVNTFHENGDVIQIDTVSGEKWNISESERQLKFEANKKDSLYKDKKAIIYQRNYEFIYKKDIRSEYVDFSKKIKLGTVYKDTESGNLYLIRRFNVYSKVPYPEYKNTKCLDFNINDKKSCQVLSFYMDLNGMLVCLSDDQLDRMNSDDSKKYNITYPSEEEIDRFIEYFNNEQKNGGIRFVNKNIKIDKESFNYWYDYFCCGMFR